MADKTTGKLKLWLAKMTDKISDTISIYLSENFSKIDDEFSSLKDGVDEHKAETALDNPHGILDRYKGFQVIAQGAASGIAIDIDLPNRERPYLYITGYGASSMYLLRVSGASEVFILPVVESPHVTITTSGMHIQIEHQYTFSYSLIML